VNAALVLRDARCDARRPRTYVVRVLYGLALAFVLERVWSAVAPAGVAPTASDLAHAGRELHRGFFIAQFAAVSLLALVAGAETLSRELRSGTMRLLVLTPVTEPGIVAAKWGAVMLQAVVLMLCGAPVLAACAYLGSVGVQDIAAGSVVTLANAALAAACGLRAASAARTPEGAILRGASGYVGWALLPAVLAIPTAGVALLMAPFLHPLYTAYYLRTSNPMLGEVAVAASAAVVGVLVHRVLHRAGAALSRRVRELPDLLEPPPAPERPGRPWALTWWPGRIRRFEVWEDAPLLWKDLFTRPAARLSGDHLLILAGAVLLAWYPTLVIDQGRNPVSVGVPLALFAALTVVAGAGLFTREKEHRRIEPLLCGPASTARIAACRLLSVLLSPEAALVGVFGAITVAVNAQGGIGQALWLGAALLLILAVLYLVAAAASVTMSTLPAAVGLTAGVVAVTWLAVPTTLPAAAEWLSPWPLLAAIREGHGVAGVFGRYAAAQALVAGALAAWIGARLRPIVLEARG